ncbi:hypothetical protein HBI45_066570 [Parastagonospora nodorum]|nr:hypothetical protein HBI45_066570 [Parastagonospora nodorum]
MLLPTLYYRPRCGLAFRHPQSWRARANLHRHRSSCSFRCCASKYAKVHKRLLLSNRDIDPIPDVQDITNPAEHAHRDVVKRGDDFRLERRVICSSFDSYLTVLGLDPPFRFLHHYPFHDMWNKPTCM